MQDRNLHINKLQANSNYPEPDIPLDNAWGMMERMLDKDGDNQSALVYLPVKDRRRRKYLLLLLFIFLGGFAFLLLKINNPTESMNTASHENEIKVKINSADSNGKSNVSNNNRNAVNINEDAIKPRKKDDGEPSINNSSLTKGGETAAIKNKDVHKDSLTVISEGRRIISFKKPGKKKNSLIDLNNHNNIEASRKNENVNVFLKHVPVCIQMDLSSTSMKHIDFSQVNIIADTILKQSIDRQLAENLNALNTNIKKDKKKPALGDKKISYGLEWSLPVPYYSAKNYFTNPNGKTQLYTLLVPAVWVSKFFHKHELAVKIYPQKQTLINNNKIKENGGPIFTTGQPPYSTSTILYKAGGYGAGFQYNYHFTGNWAIGAGIDYTKLKKALVSERATRLSDGVILSDSLYSISKSSADWQYLKSSLVSGKIELSYQFGKLQAGADMIIPLSSLSPFDNTTIRPVNVQVFLRWKLK